MGCCRVNLENEFVPGKAEYELISDVSDGRAKEDAEAVAETSSELEDQTVPDNKEKAGGKETKGVSTEVRIPNFKDCTWRGKKAALGKTQEIFP